MIISVMSGKGGAGKTTLSVFLALELAGKCSRPVLTDLDVEEPNAGLFFRQKVETDKEIAFTHIPEWDPEKCTFCRKCRPLCRFNAIAELPRKILIFGELCHSCYACSELCPSGALPMKPRRIGEISAYRIGDRLEFVEGRLDIGQEIASELVRQTRDKVLGFPDRHDCVIFDAPPGTACAARESMLKSDVVLLVAEPTPFGLHDLKLAYRLARNFGKKCAVIVNRDTGHHNEVVNFCRSENLEVIAEIPFVRGLAEDYSRGSLDIKAYPEIRMQMGRITEWLFLNAEHGVPV